MLISYCTTCKGRLAQLRTTLTSHLKFFAGREDVELVVLDYNSPDGLEAWARADRLVQAAIGGGLLVFAREETARYFHSSKAKNLAHRLARGEILVNLDADNWAIELDAELRRVFAGSPDVIVQAYNSVPDGSFGRIAISRRWFYQLGGYDETLQPMGHQDADLLNRAVARGLRKVVLTIAGQPISHSASQKMVMTGRAGALRQMVDLNRAMSDSRIARGMNTRNLGGWGAATVTVNFGSRVRLDALVPVLAGDAVPSARKGSRRRAGPPVNASAADCSPRPVGGVRVPWIAPRRSQYRF